MYTCIYADLIYTVHTNYLTTKVKKYIT